jgi:RNA polymerase-binding transcription factor DksA
VALSEQQRSPVRTDRQEGAPTMAQSSKKKKSAAKKAASKKAASTSTKRAAGRTTAKKASTSKKKAPASKKAAPKKAASKKPASKKKAGGTKATTRKAASKTKKPAVSRLDKKFLAAQKTMLLEERAKYLHSADILEAEADSLLEAREPGDVQFDEESGEGDTLAVERERDLALSAQARAAVGQIDAALGRIEDGSYGICVMSGKPIPKERLEAIPWAAERVEFKAGGIRR